MRFIMHKLQKKVINNQIVDFEKVHGYLSTLFQQEVHGSRVVSMANAVLGVMTVASLAISMIGLGLAVARGKVTKHAVKQVDRLIGNSKFLVWSYFKYWVPEVIGLRKEIVVAMDWTDFDKDNQTTLALYLATRHGRATPLLWKTYDKSQLKNNRGVFEQKILNRLKKLLPPEVKVTILADRGFGYVELYRVLTRLGFNFVIRFKDNTKIYDNKGVLKSAKNWVGQQGRAKRLVDAKVTATAKEPIPVVVCVRDKKMKEVWCLVTNNKTLKTREIINLYAKRWSIEPAFRDQKDIRFGMGMYNISVSTPMRRDRLFFIAAISNLFLSILGAASEAIGMDKMLRSNTVKRRTHSLFRQGAMLYELIPNMLEEQLKKLMKKFDELLLEKKVVVNTLSFI